MADTSQLETALVNADKAGDIVGARTLASEITRLRSIPTQLTNDPSEGTLPLRPFGVDTGLQMPQGVSRFMAGAGKAMMDTGRGIGQLVGAVDRPNVDESKKLDAPLMNTGAGLAGNIAGNVAVTAPLAMIPGAGTIGGGAVIGGATGLIQPVGTEDSRGMNTAIGAGAGMAIPTAIRAAKALRATAVDPFTEAGRTKIAGSLMNRASASPSSVATKLEAVQGATPGFNPTVGQAADDAGMGALERTMRATDPRGFDEIDKAQRGALIDALRSIAKTPEDRAIASDAVEKSAKDLYGKAFQENVKITPELSKLSIRPSMQKAEARAIGLANEYGAPYKARLEDMRPKYLPLEKPSPSPSIVNFDEITPGSSIPIGSASVTPSSVISKPSTDVIGMLKQSKEINIPNQQKATGYFDLPEMITPKSLEIPAQTRAAGYFELPSVESVPVRDMHTLKMGMDALLADPTQGIAGREAAAIARTRGQLLDQLPESYQAARLNHIEMNKPVNQMDIGKELYNRFTPALADQGGLPFKSTAQSYANALRNGDELAKSVTGLKNAKLESIMTPEQMATLQGVAKDSATKAAAENIGRGVGSDTVQKISMSNIAAEAGVPNWMASIARVPGGWLKRAGDVLYGNADEQIRSRLAELLRNPQDAAKAMKQAGATKSEIAQYLRLGAQAPAMALPAVINSGQ